MADHGRRAGVLSWRFAPHRARTKRRGIMPGRSRPDPLQQPRALVRLRLSRARTVAAIVGPRALLGRAIHRGGGTGRVVDATRDAAGLLDRTKHFQELSAALLRDRKVLCRSLHGMDGEWPAGDRYDAHARLWSQAASRDAAWG